MNTLASKSVTRRPLATLLLSACCALASAPALAAPPAAPDGAVALDAKY